jgi:hypothetical protein
MGIFLSAIYIGIINNVPTGPVSAYLLSLHNIESKKPLVAVVLGALFSDWLHLFMILSAPDIFALHSEKIS